VAGLTGRGARNQPRAGWEAKKLKWNTQEVVDRAVSSSPQLERHFLDPADATVSERFRFDTPLELFGYF
jgi:hypothetical protein